MILKAAVYANGSEKIGMGHIIRTMALADVLRTKEIEVEYISGSSSIDCIRFIESRGYTVKAEFLSGIKYSFIIADSYDVDSTEKLLSFYKFGEKVIYIDDLNMLQSFDIDILVNYAVGAEKLNYRGKAIKLLGSSFTPLRAQFLNTSYRHPKHVIKNVMITIGAADEFNYTEYILKKMLQSFPALNYKVVLGMANRNKDKIINVFKGQNVEFYTNVENMASLMQENDAAISAGGSTIYELCACSIPVVAVITADNQKKFISAMNKKTALEYVDFTNGPHDEVINKFKKLYNNYDYRKKLSDDMNSLVDGKGVYRIVQAILK